MKPGVLLASLLIVAACGRGDYELSAEDRYAWLHMQGNLRAQQKLLAIAKTPSPDSVIQNVNLIDVVNGTVIVDASVIVRNGKIDAIDTGPGNADVDGLRVIDGGGAYLAPGLTDMHVHTHDDADYLLHLAHGVTTIREMNGWRWRLERRRASDAGKLLLPNMYVSSQILNSGDFGGYAIPVTTRDEAIDAVRQAAQQGYDAIKIHNGLSNEIFHAIAKEAAAQGLPLVGHIPVRVSVAEAIAAGMHTAEHFKGYIDDSVLEISGDDWLTASIGMQTYLTPTFYTYREHLRGADAAEVIRRDASKVLPHRLIRWQSHAAEEADAITELRQTIRPKSEQIFKTLMPLQPRWLAGTDSGGYELMVPGEALLEELEIMQSLGLAPAEALRTATTTAAEAMGMSSRIGQVAAGFDADLVLLAKNPLESVANLRSIVAVMRRGAWFDDPMALIENGAGLDSGVRTVSYEDLDRAVAMAERHESEGYAQSTLSLELWTGLVRAAGATGLVARLEKLAE